ncbi:MAG TPA: SDR family oxidoreductase [Hyphomicrobiaceae bacterium]|nr:SDR family oxidoreductase [Hyphomicrobiaceae bacterium]
MHRSSGTGREAMVAGATGAVAKRLIEVLAADPGWSVIGVSRNPPGSAPARTRYVPVDLLDPADCRRRLEPFSGVTHLFYCARARHGEGGTESVEENVAMLRNVLDAVEAAAPGLQHVHVVEGLKWYGVHLGPYPTPAQEDDPRHMPPNFYYDQEDLVRQRRLGKEWTWSASRPNAVCDVAPERVRNLIPTLGAYAAICAELGMPLDFPGRPGTFRALTELTDATLLARAIVHMATTAACRNEAFNVTNGDVVRWSRLWARIASFYGLAVGSVRPLKLTEWMRDKEPVWQRVVHRHGLEPRRLDAIAHWGFADFVLAQDYDVVSRTTKLRRTGFAEFLDTEDMVLDHLARYRQARLLP